ncbi:MAG: permease [Planctomycetes bacterium]|nr:permease [Planctomycetota bacterium]
MPKRFLLPGFLVVYASVIVISWLVDFQPGKEIAAAFSSFGWQMVRILPCAFILIGLFEAWVKTETVEKHLGGKSGLKGLLWALVLASTSVGGFYVSLPLAHALHQKGTRLAVVFTLVSASAICRVPMGIFEASFLGLKFTLIRLVIAIPLVIISSLWLERYATRKGITLPDG